MKTKSGNVFRQAAILATCILPLWAQPVWAERIKDLASIQGVRNNQLIGYGIVVGLDNSGDQTTQTPFTTQAMSNMLSQLGINLTQEQSQKLQLKNVAAVMVTANLPAFAGAGSRIDVSVSAMGDAKNLTGGTLLVTPLFGADGQTYAVGQGPVAVGGFSAQGAAASVTQGVPTAGRIANGAILLHAWACTLAKLDLDMRKHSGNGADLEFTRDKAAALGGAITREAGPVKGGSSIIAFITDPDGYKIELIQRDA